MSLRSLSMTPTQPSFPRLCDLYFLRLSTVQPRFSCSGQYIAFSRRYLLPQEGRHLVVVRFRAIIAPKNLRQSWTHLLAGSLGSNAEAPVPSCAVVCRRVPFHLGGPYNPPTWTRNHSPIIQKCRLRIPTQTNLRRTERSLHLSQATIQR